MNSPLESLFAQLSAIEHCSGGTQALRDFICSHAPTTYYRVDVDSTGNVGFYAPDATVTLQAHYDMVCMGSAPAIDIIEESGWLKARNSSLGADNGIAVALMLLLAQEKVCVNMLFTNDEEIGLVGARELQLPIVTPNVLNLDSEEEGIVYIGCAGGVDVVIDKAFETSRIEGEFVRLSTQGLIGGHSGVDIDKKITSATALMASMIDAQSRLVSMVGGERRNAIAVSGALTVSGRCEDFAHHSHILCTPVQSPQWVIEDEGVAQLFKALPHGVLTYDTLHTVVDTSANLAIVTIDENRARFQLSLRSMRSAGLDEALEQVASIANRWGASMSASGRYEPWEAKPNPFATQVEAIVRQTLGSVQSAVMHAGLECGILQQHAPNAYFASIGPTIEAPHSVHERVERATVERFEILVRRIISAV